MPSMATNSIVTEELIPHYLERLVPDECTNCTKKLSQGDVLCQCRDCPDIILCQECEQSVLLHHLISYPSHVFMKRIFEAPDLADIISLPLSDEPHQTADKSASSSDLGSEWVDCPVENPLIQVEDESDQRQVFLRSNSGWSDTSDWIKTWSETGQLEFADQPSQDLLSVFQPNVDETDNLSFSIIDQTEALNVQTLSDTSDDEDDEDGDVQDYCALKGYPAPVKPIHALPTIDINVSLTSEEDRLSGGGASPSNDVGLNLLATQEPLTSDECSKSESSETIDDLAELAIQTVQNAGAAFLENFSKLMDSWEECYSLPSSSYQKPESKYVPPTVTYVPPTVTYVPQPKYFPKTNTYIPRQNTYIPRQDSCSVIHRHLKDLETPWIPKQKYTPKMCN